MKGCTGNSLACMCLIENIPYRVCLLSHRNSCSSLFPGHSLCKFTFLFRNKCGFYRDPPRSCSQGSCSQLPCAPAAGFPPSCPLLSTWEFEKWGEKIIPWDLNFPHDFKTGSLGLQMTFPQGTAAAKGFWILFYLHTEWRPGTAASPNTDPSGQHQLDWLS